MTAPATVARQRRGWELNPRKWLPAGDGEIKCARCRVRLDNTDEDRRVHDRHHEQLNDHIHEGA